MLGSVIVIGLPDLICSIQSGMTDPREHMTLLARTCGIARLTACLFGIFTPLNAVNIHISVSGKQLKLK